MAHKHKKSQKDIVYVATGEKFTLELKSSDVLNYKN